MPLARGFQTTGEEVPAGRVRRVMMQAPKMSLTAWIFETRDGLALERYGA